MTTNHLHYILSATAILAGIILILCGMDLYRALYLIIFGLVFIPFRISDFQNRETPKGVKFWAMKVFATTMGLIAATSLANFLVPNHTDGFKGVIIWLCVVMICGIVFGTFDYFAHNTGCDEAEFEARKRQQQKMGEFYDKVVEEMNTEKNQKS